MYNTCELENSFLRTSIANPCWKELYLTCIGHSISHGVWDRENQLVNYDLSDPGENISHSETSRETWVQEPGEAELDNLHTPPKIDVFKDFGLLGPQHFNGMAVVTEFFSNVMIGKWLLVGERWFLSLTVLRRVVIWLCTSHITAHWYHHFWSVCGLCIHIFLAKNISSPIILVKLFSLQKRTKEKKLFGGIMGSHYPTLTSL
jgi:hypothetical protein